MLYHSTWHPLLSKSHNKTDVLPSRQCFFQTSHPSKKHDQMTLPTPCFQSVDYVVYFQNDSTSHGLSQALCLDCFHHDQAKTKCTGNHFICNVLFFHLVYLFSSLATFLAVLGKVGILCIFVFWCSAMLFVVIGGFDSSSRSESMYISLYLHPLSKLTFELQHGRKCFTCLLCWLTIISWI